MQSFKGYTLVGEGFQPSLGSYETWARQAICNAQSRKLEGGLETLPCEWDPQTGGIANNIIFGQGSVG